MKPWDIFLRLMGKTNRKIVYVIGRSKIMKKFMSFVLSGAIIVASIPMQTRAAMIVTANDSKVVNAAIAAGEPTPSKEVEVYGSKEPMTGELEKAILAVKSKIEIPSVYSEFNYYFNASSAYSNFYWQLTWRSPEDGSYIQVNCDEDNHITNFEKRDYSHNGGYIPAFLKKELKATADEFIKLIAPEVSSKLDYVDATYEGIYSGAYHYQYQRIEKGVIFPDNTVNVSVNSETGEAVSASIEWLYDAKIPSATTEITKDAAAVKIGKNLEMELVYYSDYYGIYDDTKHDQTKAYLVYQPKINYISIDAKTGDVYLTRTEWVEKYGNGSTSVTAESASDEADKGEAQLTEEEIAKIEELKKLISRDAAIKAVTSNQFLLIDKKLKAFTATLNKSYNNGNEEAYVWNISLSDPREVNSESKEDNYRAYAYAQVDAKSGKILSFNASLKSNYDENKEKWNTVKIKYDKEDGQETLEKFLRREIKNRLDNSKLVDKVDSYIAYYKGETPIYGGYSFQYQRVNEGVLYSYNSIYGSVDGVTGKIYSYGSNWDDKVVFESPKGAITPKQAFDYYIQKDGYHLVYEVNEINIYDKDFKSTEQYYDYSDAYSIEKEVRLVYRADINPSFISPFTGEQLDYKGDVFKVEGPYSYLDIKETKENREILLLSDMNIGFDGEYFYPDKEITKGELTVLLQKIGYGYETTEDTNADKVISREEIAGQFINNLGLEKIAALQGIYQTGYADQASIEPKLLGAVSLAKGLDLIVGNQNNLFSPKSNVTRAEAVHLVLNFIKVQKTGIYY